MTGPANAPLFTVVMATWGRGRHILPSIQSVLRQDYPAFELVVVGDACTDETEAVVTGLDDPRLHWINLKDRVGSQSGPNNAGIAAARGEFIAYLGHDDLWAPGHLAVVADAFQKAPGADFVISGMICHPPSGLPGVHVFGVFPEDTVIEELFLPPSGFAHRHAVINQIGGWRLPGDLHVPVDLDLIWRANRADLSFRSTGQVTVHKFSAAERYLCYVRPDCLEQEAMLASFNAPDHADRIAAAVAQAKSRGAYMPKLTHAFEHLKAGEFQQNALSSRGVQRPTLRALGKGAIIRHRQEPCALDWEARPVRGIRRHKLNPRPRLLLPFSATGPVEMTFRVEHPDRAAFADLALLCNGEPVIAHRSDLRWSLWGWKSSQWGWTARFRAVIGLRADQHSLIELLLDPVQQRKHAVGPLIIGFGIGRIKLRPVRS